MNKKCVTCRVCFVKDPSKLIRYIILLVCCIVVIIQLYECFSKLRTPPISTHSYFSLNETIDLPALTFCREPPYKQEVLENYTHKNCYHPALTSCWKYFDFNDTSLDEVFDKSTYNIDESIIQMGLLKETKNIVNSTTLNFNLGKCHTIKPLTALKYAHSRSGYSVLLKHDHQRRSLTTEPQYGWHIYFHQASENFSEVPVKALGKIDYVFAETEEEVEIKLTNQYYMGISTTDDICIENENYSNLLCEEQCILGKVLDKEPCSGPWMNNIDAKRCANETEMKNSIVVYEKIYEGEVDTNCSCTKSCKSNVFSAFVQNRKIYRPPVPEYYTQVYVYYTTKLITMVEERPSYDLTQFIADIGGSLGFLLGLSVLGLIGILEHLTLIIFGSLIKKCESRQDDDDTSSTTSKNLDPEKCSNISDETLRADSIKNQK